ncbi:MAG: pentapeptide repeat-containing protein [Leptolyngbyaceae cyanobacterium MO_188.B28]|nr:pentapeptide repeat-containing protein [Leptolyngbyaceae cyanobacterium MO_188.B28]
MARTKFLAMGLGLAALLWLHPGFAQGNGQGETLSQEELHNLCSKYPFNSRCEGYEIPITLEDRPGSKIFCFLELHDPTRTDQCKLVITDEELTLYIEEGKRLSFLDDQRASQEIKIPIEDIFAFNLRIWNLKVDFASIFILGDLRYVLEDELYSNFEREFDPTSNSNEREEIGSQDFAEVEIDFLGAPPNEAGNQSNILQIVTTEELGAFLRDRLMPLIADSSADTYRNQLVGLQTKDAIAANQSEQINQLLETKACVGCDLTGADLRDADLEDANLEGADLQNAYLTDADLEDAYLVGANLAGATLTDADLSGARLTLATMASVNAEGANLEAASLQRTDFQNAMLSDAQFSGADLEAANLENANLENADLSDSTWFTSSFGGGARFKYYTFAQNANFRGANLLNANLEDAYLNHSDLSNADLTNANLDETNLSDVNLTGARIDLDAFSNMNLCGATLPDGVISDQGCE